MQIHRTSGRQNSPLKARKPQQAHRPAGVYSNANNYGKIRRVVHTGTSHTSARIAEAWSLVVETNDVLVDIENGLRFIGIAALPDPLHFQGQEESLHHRVVPAVVSAARADRHAMSRRRAAMGMACVLAAA